MTKRLNSIILSAFMVVAAQAQLIKPDPSSVWYYHYNDNAGTEGYVKLVYESQTVVSGDTIIDLSHTLYSAKNGVRDTVERDPIRLKYADSVVYYWNQTQFDVLFKFNAKVGDMWFYRNQYVDSVSAKVTLVSNNSGVWGKQIFLTYRDSIGQTAADNINERGLRGDKFFFPWDVINNFTPKQLGGRMRCYSDDVADYKDPTWGAPCDAPLTSSIPDHEQYRTIELYPNPATSYFRLDDTHLFAVDHVVIYDRYGAVVSAFNGTHEHYSIDHLATGIYTVEVRSDHKIMHARLLKH